MSAGHDHGKGANEKAMWSALFLTGGFMVAEVIGGLLTGSLALISDAAHMMTDTAALGIALFAIRMGRRAADARRTFGYARFEILAATFNAAMLFVVAIYIFVEAVERFRNPTAIQSTAMLAIAALGLVVNMISMRLLTKGKDSSLNVKGAYLEVWSDMLGSIGVIAGAGVIRVTGWTWIDPIIAVAIALWVLPRTWTLLRASINVLLEGTPDEIELPKVSAAIMEHPGVDAMHDLHVWAITSGKTSLSAHLVLEPDADAQVVRMGVAALLKEEFGIRHSTLQCELVACSESVECALVDLASEASHEEHSGHSHKDGKHDDERHAPGSHGHQVH